MTIAITGGTGFVGQATLDVHEARSIAVRALARNAPDDRPAMDWITGNLSNFAALDRLVEGADAVIHIAGLTNSVNPDDFEAANVTGTRAMIDAARRAGTQRFIFISSLSAREPQLSAYGASKARAEELVVASDLDWTIVRPPAVYGPRDKDMFELFRAARYGLVPLPPAGRTSLIHVQDLAELLAALARTDQKISGQVFEPDDGRRNGWEHREMAQIIGAAMGKTVWAPHMPAALLHGAAKIDRLLRGKNAKLTPDRANYMVHPDWVVNPDNAVPASLWQPRLPSSAGMKNTAQWYHQQGWL